MNNKVFSIFYGEDLLPYKDAARSVHFPITGNSFVGTNNTKTIRFYVSQIGGTDGISWVVMSKLPNGKIGYEPVTSVGTDTELNEKYLDFDLSSYYTSVKGDLYLALRGYQGEITFTEGEGGVYEINGDPLIEVTGTIKFAINYSPMINTGTQVLPTDVDKILAALGDYIKNGDGIIVIESTSSDVSSYEDGQIFYSIAQKDFYQKSSGSLVAFDDIWNYVYINYVKKTYTFSVLDSTITIASAVGTKNPFFFTYTGNTQKYFGIYNGATFTFIRCDTLDIWTNVPLNAFAILSNVLTTSSTYYVPYATKNYVDSNFVGLSGNQTIAGVKTFESSPIVPEPTNNTDAANKKYVNDQIEAGLASLGYVFNYRGSFSVSYINTNLTTDVLVKGDVVNVTDSGTLTLGNVQVLAGDNVVWDGTAWDKLAGTIDLSGYVQKTTTIAGIDLQDNITAQELTDALVYATSSDIEGIMED